jgi:glycosyltransferase involved in cell wall biosynthesis
MKEIKNTVDISVVVPLYNEEESLPELCAWIAKVMDENNFSYEVLLIDDGSKDNSWEVVKAIRESNSHVKGVKFMRNYGKSAALQVGFKACIGQVVITMDADLQDSPDEIPGLYKMIKEEGFDLVSGWKQKRYDPLSKTIPTKLFNYATTLLSGIKLHDFNCGLKAYNSKVVKRIDVFGEMHRYIPVIAKWQGFTKIGEKVVVHRSRKYGVTKFGLERFVFGFLDLLSISFVSKFKKSPMHFFGSLGTLSFVLGFFMTMYLLGHKQYCIYNHLPFRNVTDNPFFYLSLVALMIGSQLFLAGFIGEMINIDSNKKDDYGIEEQLG